MSKHAVLIVDDDPQARETARLAVQLAAEASGASLVALMAENGETALRHLRSQPPDTVRVVVLDLNFPGEVDGRFIAPLIRVDFPTLPIVPFTADRKAAEPQHWQTFGLPEPILKPCAPEALATRIRAALVTRDTPPLSPVEEFLVEQARQMVQLIQRTKIANRAMQVGLLAATHLELAGLAFVLSEVKRELPLDITVSSERGDSVIAYSRSARLDVLVATPLCDRGGGAAIDRSAKPEHSGGADDHPRADHGLPGSVARGHLPSSAPDWRALAEFAPAAHAAPADGRGDDRADR